MTPNHPPHLYRIISFKHLVDMFETRKLFLAAPRLWDDPYEKVLVHKRSHAFFAQCWGKRAVSDAMWRIYSPDHTAVRVRTSRTKLISALKAVRTTDGIDYVVKDVEYVTSRKIDGRIAQIAADLKVDYKSRRAADALLVKRDAFDHESEVRVIVHDVAAKDGADPQSSYRVPVDPHKLVENVFFDPRADEAFIRVCTYYLRNSLKFKNSIGKSALYKVREEVLVK